MKLKYLYQENGFLYFRNKKGQIQKHPKNKFEHNEIVTTTSKHFSRKNITRLINPRYTESRGWVYTENYINEQGSGGGCGSCFNENLYDKITDPKFLMIAKRIELKEDHYKAKILFQRIQDDLNKLEFTMDIAIKEDYKNANQSCKKCGRLFEDFKGGDPNKDLCETCLILIK